MKHILGISAFYHDSAAALVSNGEIVAAAQEERFTRQKHDKGFPRRAAAFCLAQHGVQAADLTHVAYYEKPWTKFGRLLSTYCTAAPQGLKSFVVAMPSWLRTKLRVAQEIRKGAGVGERTPIIYCRHHESHAASAFFPSPFTEAAVLTIDGVGEWDTASISIGKDNRLDLIETMRFPHSLGLLYSAFTYFLGFKVDSGEYKVMGLAPYGEPSYVGLIMDKLIRLHEDGSFTMNMRYFNYAHGLTMTNDRFARLFGGSRREPESMLTKRELDLAASIQVVAELIVLRMAKRARELTGMRHLCLAGGVALNCVANGKLLQTRLFDEVWIQPAAGDAGGALGAALFAHYHVLQNARVVHAGDSMRGALLGPAYTNAEIGAFLDEMDARYIRFENEHALLKFVVESIQRGEVIGWFHGRMEFGPRALGARSIIADARNPDMQASLNLRIKCRESFRPFAPSVLREDVTSYFELDRDSPYMLFVANIQPHLRLHLSDDELKLCDEPDLRRRLSVIRSTLPAVTHVDMSSRVQTVDEARHGRFYRLLREFKRQTNCSVVINTSFNVRSEPIVCSPQDAYRCFMATEMDMLVLEDCVLRKNQQRLQQRSNRQEYLDNFPLD